MKDITHAIARPSYWSRTKAVVMLRGPATPMPCSSNRPINMLKTAGEHREQAADDKEQ